MLPEEQCGFGPSRSVFMARRIQELGRARGTLLFLCFVNPQNAYDTTLSAVLSCGKRSINYAQHLQRSRLFGRSVTVRGARVLVDNDVLSDWFSVEQDILWGKGCVLSSLLL